VTHRRGQIAAMHRDQAEHGFGLTRCRIERLASPGQRLRAIEGRRIADDADVEVLPLDQPLGRIQQRVGPFQVDRAIDFLPRFGERRRGELVGVVARAQAALVRAHVGHGAAAQPSALPGRNLEPELRGNRPRHRLLNIEDVVHRPVELLRPERDVARGVDELRRDAKASARAANAARDDVLHAENAGDGGNGLSGALGRRRRSARDDAEGVDRRQVGDDLLGDAGAEIVAVLRRAQIVERQDGDRPGRLRRCRDDFAAGSRDLELLDDLRHRSISTARLFVQTAFDDLAKAGSDRVRQRSGVAIHDPVEAIDVAPAGESRPAAQHFVKHAAKGEHIGAPIDGTRLRLFR
jgi:hypothetical protein